MKKYQDDMARSVHETMEGLYKLGAISPSEMHDFDVDCLVPSRVPIRETFSSSEDSRPSTPIPAVAAARA
jgi:DNA-binding transcriptional regulator YiaG